MSLTIKQVEYIATLACLGLTEEEKAEFAEQHSDILDYAAILDGVDTTAIPPTATVTPSQRAARDVVAPVAARDDVLANAPTRRAVISAAGDPRSIRLTSPHHPETEAFVSHPLISTSPPTTAGRRAPAPSS